MKPALFSLISSRRPRLPLAPLLLLAALGCSRKDPPAPAPTSAATPIKADPGLAPASATLSVASAQSGAPSAAAASAAPSGKKAFGAFCVADGECEGTVCFHQRIKTPDAGKEHRGVDNGPEEHDGYCSLRCKDDADCPTPLTRGKCGARGMCKRP